MILEINDLSNPDLEIFTNLTDVALRRRLEPEQGIFMAESFNVIDRAIRAGNSPIAFLVSPRWLEKLSHTLSIHDIPADGGNFPIYLAEENVLEELTGFHLHRGAMAAMERPVLLPAKEMLSNPKIHRVLVLEDLVDHTNVGACFRSAAALQIDLVLITPSCADPLYRRSVRVSMGTVFQVPWTRIDKWPNLEVFHETGFHTAALALSEDSISLDDFSATDQVLSPTSRLALIMGTEGDGLRKRTIAQADSVVKIPMTGGVDSLNVAAASAVAIWETRYRTPNQGC
ncbi:RNA methyltransferase [Actinomycetaceae bacterium TAE3-ERU4]|nr:RNA methyltransferase [Actinomycetaceae bacterium TAE3-ERU4]